MLNFTEFARFRRAVLVVAGIFIAVPFAGAADYFEGFDDITALPGAGWSFQNLSDPPGTSWFQGNTANFTAEAGPSNSYLAASSLNVDDFGTISNWAITPEITYSNGDTFSFYTRTVENPTEAPDRLEVRLSEAGASTDVGTSATSVGDFTMLLLEINPGLTTTGYPAAWTQYVITLSGLDAPTSGRIAFRYFVTNGGFSGINSDYIGIDTLRITTVPEPSAYAMGTLGASVLVFARLRGRRNRC